MTDTATAAPADTSPLTLDEAFDGYVERKTKETEQPAESAETATADPQSEAKAEDAAPPQEATGETQEQAPAETPPRELPRSWTKDRAQHWNKLDPDTQDFLLEQDRKASAEVRRVQNDAAEKLKGLTAKEQQAEQARQSYEARLPEVMQALQDAHSQEFPDIKSMADVEKIANAIRTAQLSGDPFTAGELTGYLQRWQVHQQKLATVKAELDQAEGRKLQEQQTNWQSFRQKESSLATELIPELADEKKGPELMAKAAKLLRDVKFSQDELNALDRGEKISPFDHRMQAIIADAVKYRDIMATKTAVAAKPVPPVQRPGARQPSGAANDANIQALRNKLTETGDIDDAFALYRARKAAKA